MGESEANISQSKEEKTVEETKAVIQETENKKEESSTEKTNLGDTLKRGELPREKVERLNQEKQEVANDRQDETLGLQAGFLGVFALFASIASDIFQKTDFICGIVVTAFIFISLSKPFHKCIKKFIMVEGASDVINTITVLATIYFCAEKIYGVASCELRIVAFIFLVFCAWLLFYVFYYKRREHKEEKTTRISIETDKNVDIHITEKQDPDGDNE